MKCEHCKYYDTSGDFTQGACTRHKTDKPVRSVLLVDPEFFCGDFVMMDLTQATTESQ
jgi:hypothetical protein